MQRPDDAKRRQILDTAARLFAAKPFQEVKLDDIAAAAKLGKGTIYIYFKSKDNLYVGLILDGIEGLLAELKGTVEGTPARPGAWSVLENIVGSLLAFGRRYPHLYSLMRAGVDIKDPRLNDKRAEVASLCEQAIRRGVRAGEIADPHPALTAQYLLSFVRVALLYAPPGVSEASLRKHILRVLGRGIRGENTREQ
ncbi:MAG: TetR/AcrR family transcriptional regulator [Phycisphaerales bacterium]